MLSFLRQQCGPKRFPDEVINSLYVRIAGSQAQHLALKKASDLDVLIFTPVFRSYNETFVFLFESIREYLRDWDKKSEVQLLHITSTFAKLVIQLTRHSASFCLEENCLVKIKFDS